MATIYTRITYAHVTPEDLSDAYILLTNSQDIDSINDYFGQVCKDENFSSFFVDVGDGDYNTVYGCPYAVPHNTDPLYLVEMIHE